MKNAYSEGYDAYMRGISETANPYDLETEAEDHMDWNDGWMAAAEEDE
jgi:ribosome modulation factor